MFLLTNLFSNSSYILCSFHSTLHYKMCCVLLILTVWAYCLIACCRQPGGAVLRHLDPLRLPPQQGSQKPAWVFLSELMLQPKATFMTGSEGRQAQCQLSANQFNIETPVHNVTNSGLKGSSFLIVLRVVAPGWGARFIVFLVKNEGKMWHFSCDLLNLDFIF